MKLIKYTGDTCLRAHISANREQNHMKSILGMSTPDGSQVYKVSLEYVKNCWNTLLHKLFENCMVTPVYPLLWGRCNGNNWQDTGNDYIAL